MRRPKLKELDLPTLEKLVKECAKQRFTMRGEPTGKGGGGGAVDSCESGSLVGGEFVGYRGEEGADAVPRRWRRWSLRGLRRQRRFRWSCMGATSGCGM